MVTDCQAAGDVADAALGQPTAVPIRVWLMPGVLAQQPEQLAHVAAVQGVADVGAVPRSLR